MTGIKRQIPWQHYRRVTVQKNMFDLASKASYQVFSKKRIYSYIRHIDCTFLALITTTG